MEHTPPGEDRGDGEDDEAVPRLRRAQEDRLDAALADYRDRTYAQWAVPEGTGESSALLDRRIAAALAAAPSPARPRRLLRYGLVAAAAAVGVLATTVALSTVRDTPVEPENGVLLAAAVPGGDRGPFTDDAALSRCLDAAAVAPRERLVLGAGTAEVKGERATVLLLRGSTLGRLRVLAVEPACAQGLASSVLVNRVLPAAGADPSSTP